MSGIPVFTNPRPGVATTGNLPISKVSPRIHGGTPTNVTRNDSTTTVPLEPIFRDKKQLASRVHNIVITDSGSGGLSTMAELVRRLEQASPFPRVRVTYFNCLPENGYGYQDFRSTGRRVAVFDNALRAMDRLYQPDLFMIACNTLSVLYESTEYAHQTQKPVLGIVEPSTEMMLNFFKQYSDGQLIVFGTNVTISSNVYVNRLMAHGINRDRIICQACSRLHQHIEIDGHNSDRTRKDVLENVKRAIDKLNGYGGPLAASLNCTHYGYATDLFWEAFDRLGISLNVLLNPNAKMVDLLYKGSGGTTYDNPQIEIAVESQTKIAEGQFRGIGELLRQTSPRVANAFFDYKHRPNTFEWASVPEQE